MFGILHPTQTFARAPIAPRGADLEAVTLEFLLWAQRSALARFAGDPRWARGCHTAQVAVPVQPGRAACTGAIVAHVSATLVQEWTLARPGTPRQRKAHVLDQLQLVLKDLADHDVHGYLTLTPTQCEVYGQDLAQLVAEGLQRTTFAALGRQCSVQWEGTLVRSLQPPAFVLVISVT